MNVVVCVLTVTADMMHMVTIDIPINASRNTEEESSEDDQPAAVVRVSSYIHYMVSYSYFTMQGFSHDASR